VPSRAARAGRADSYARRWVANAAGAYSSPSSSDRSGLPPHAGRGDLDEVDLSNNPGRPLPGICSHGTTNSEYE
jgi:hypothetical protein